MRLSIIVPNYNGADYLHECIESVLSQNYPDLDLVVIDGGSKDRSGDIIRSFGKSISYCVSEPDGGQSSAINKGIRVAQGEVISFLNSDDKLAPGSLWAVAAAFERRPKARWVVGSCAVFGSSIDKWILKPEGWRSLSDTVLPWKRDQQFVFPQSGASFMRRSLVTELGFYDESLHYSMDIEYYVRAAFQRITMHIVNQVLAEWRIHPNAKTWKRGLMYGFRKDEVEILRRYQTLLQGDEHLNAHQEYERMHNAVQITEAAWLAEHGERRECLHRLAASATSHPRNLLNRAWLGALRRALAVPVAKKSQ